MEEEPPPATIAQRVARLKLAQEDVDTNKNNIKNTDSALALTRKRPPNNRGLPPPQPASRSKYANRTQTVNSTIEEHDDAADTPLKDLKYSPRVHPQLRGPPSSELTVPTEYVQCLRRSPNYSINPPLFNDRPKSPSTSSAYSTSSADTFDSVHSAASSATDVSITPKLPPRGPSRPSLPPAKAVSWKKPSLTEGPRKLPPLNDALLPIVAWKQPVEKKPSQTKTSMTNRLKKASALTGSQDSERPMPLARTTMLPMPTAYRGESSQSPSRNSTALKEDLRPSRKNDGNLLNATFVPIYPEPAPPPPPRKVTPLPHILQMGFGRSESASSPQSHSEMEKKKILPPPPPSTRPKIKSSQC